MTVAFPHDSLSMTTLVGGRRTGRTRSQEKSWEIIGKHIGKGWINHLGGFNLRTNFSYSSSISHEELWCVSAGKNRNQFSRV